MATTVAKILGVLYVAIGVAGLVVGEDADRYHNLLHLLTGLLALSVGFAASPSGARRFCLAVGTAYLAFGAIGIVLGSAAMDRELDIGLMRVSMGDHVHHAVLGTIMLAGGIFTTGQASRSGARSIRHTQAAARPEE
jgi:hypothetical protein